MKKIYNYKLKDFQEFQYLELPLNSTVLTIQNQNETPVLCAIVDPNEKKTKRISIQTVLTGQEFDIDDSIYTYVFTCQFNAGSHVRHYFINVID